MTGNNHRCPCGSGKKYKKCCKEQKYSNKETSITFNMGKETVLDGLTINANGTIYLKQGNLNIVPQKTAYSQINKREGKRDKVTLSAPILDQSNINMHMNGNFMFFDYLFVIDTNSLASTQQNIMSSASVMMFYKKIGSEFVLINSFMKKFEHDSNIHGEKCGLIDLIKYIINELKISEMESIAIVTDHDLGSHEKYNSQEIPILAGTELYLPKNIKLIYASADKKNASFLSQLINICDKEASLLLRSLKGN